VELLSPLFTEIGEKEEAPSDWRVHGQRPTRQMLTGQMPTNKVRDWTNALQE